MTVFIKLYLTSLNIKRWAFNIHPIWNVFTKQCCKSEYMASIHRFLCWLKLQKVKYDHTRLHVKSTQLTPLHAIKRKLTKMGCFLPADHFIWFGTRRKKEGFMQFPTVAVSFVSNSSSLYAHKDKLNSVFTHNFEKMVVRWVKVLRNYTFRYLKQVTYIHYYLLIAVLWAY